MKRGWIVEEFRGALARIEEAEDENVPKTRALGLIKRGRPLDGRA